jgi:hypothetical protein
MDVHDGFGTDGSTGAADTGSSAFSDGSGTGAGYGSGAGAGAGAEGPGGVPEGSGGVPEGSGGVPEGSGGGTEGPGGGTEGSGGGIEGSTTMTVEVDGQTRELPAEHDYTGDGRPDAAVETPDGKVIVFADTEDNSTGAPGPDGKADEAYIVDKQSGQVVGAAHIDPQTGEWVAGVDADDPAAASGGPTTGEASS